MADQKQGGGGRWFRGPEIFGVLLIIVGVIYFLGNANLIQISWNLIWPLLLVAAGVAILLSAMRPQHDLPGSVDIPRDGVTELELDLTCGAGTFRVQGGATHLVEVRSNRQDIVSRVDHRGSRSRVRLSQDAPWFTVGSTIAASWELSVAGDVATALSVSGGAGRIELDLSAIRIVDAKVSVGAADARVTLPQPTGEVAVKVTSGAASVTIQAPPGVEYRVVTSGGLLQVAGQTETPGYATARDRVTVTVTGGVSSIRVL